MAAPARLPINARDLVRWLAEDVAPALPGDTEVVAHGGTALTLRRLKPATKDMDFGFRTRADFERFASALSAIGYRVTRDFRPNPREVYLRLERPDGPVGEVDLRFPTWNNWRLTDAVLGRADILSFGRARVVLPSREAIFLFKTYPLREADLDDLRAVLDVSPPNQDAVIALFGEQDGIHRRELMADVDHEPLFRLVELRTRFAGSFALLGRSYRARVPRVAKHAGERFRQLRLGVSLGDLLALLRDPERLVDWDDVLGDDAERLRRRLSRTAREAKEG
ncbi:MAG: hypothetical protein A3K65_06260 [Euryarchaeota archaeon RBG_16_68_12]|nr:MAG: hypothetical protein A3K65_06260 [Euryarchaeota archaeon RBG_16_68_12]